jgi:hypothetical protein
MERAAGEGDGLEPKRRNRSNSGSCPVLEAIHCRPLAEKRGMPLKYQLYPRLRKQDCPDNGDGCA